MSAIGVLITALVIVVIAMAAVHLFAQAGMNGTVRMVIYVIAGIILLLLLLQLVGVVNWWPARITA